MFCQFMNIYSVLQHDAYFNLNCSVFIVYGSVMACLLFKDFDTVGWVTGRESGL